MAGLVNPWECNLAIGAQSRKMKSFILTVKLCSWRSLRRAEFTKEWMIQISVDVVNELYVENYTIPRKTLDKISWISFQPCFWKNCHEGQKPLSNLRKSAWNLVQSCDAQNQKAASAHFLKLRGRMGNSLEHKISHLTLYKKMQKKPQMVQTSKIFI